MADFFVAYLDKWPMDHQKIYVKMMWKQISCRKPIVLVKLIEHYIFALMKYWLLVTLRSIFTKKKQNNLGYIFSMCTIKQKEKPYFFKKTLSQIFNLLWI
jgi:hypothetical protein